MNHADASIGQPVLDDFRALSSLLKADVYTPEIKAQIEQLIDKYKLLDRSASHRDMILREVRGTLWTQHEDGTRTWRAEGAPDFLGWPELVTESVTDLAIENTARVIAEVDADIQVLVEVEDRITLQRFHDEVLLPMLPSARGAFPHCLLMDGNDPRGIDLGLLSRVNVAGMRTHVALRNAAGNAMFPRDCAAYFFELPGTPPVTMIVLANHFSSQASDRTGKRRAEQSARVAAVVDQMLAFTPFVAVVGDLNEAPSRGNLASLLQHPSLADVMSLPQYAERDTFPGTYKTGSAGNKLDYIFLSKALQQRVQAVGVERRGTRSSKWTAFESLQGMSVAKAERFQASDHHCVWVDLAF
jgi:endonuclease/exonuclease/phosphatase family metal-dependent hydrolase